MKLKSPIENYGSLMWTIRNRFDLIDALRQSNTNSFSRAETAAFNGRKIIEAIAFGCLVATENGLKKIPNDAKGQWNAEKIFKSLKTKNITALPSPTSIRPATPEEVASDKVKFTIEGIPENRLTYEELIKIYQSLHSWLQEINPYSNKEQSDFYIQKSDALWHDLERLYLFVDRHFISIHGVAFLCISKDKQDGQTKVIPLTKEA